MTDPLTPESSPILLQNIYNKAYLAVYSPNMLAYPICIQKNCGPVTPYAYIDLPHTGWGSGVLPDAT